MAVMKSQTYGLSHPRRQLMLGILYSLFLTWPTVANGSTIHVLPGTTTIQDAVAQAAAGDSIVLLPGTYALVDGIVMKGGITVTSQAGPGLTILDMAGSSDVGVFFFFNVAIPSTIEGLTI